MEESRKWAGWSAITVATAFAITVAQTAGAQQRTAVEDIARYRELL